MRGAVVIATACVAITVAPVLAQEGGEVATPDQRIDVGIEGGQTGPQSGSVQGEGNVGAYHFDNTASGGPEGFSFTNPPMYGAVGSGGGEYEEIYGPPPVRAALGTGGLTAGFKATGVLANLAWPGPGFFDHVNLLNRTRNWANQGAPENAGSFAGLVFADGVTWFTEVEGWSPVDQAYEGPASGVLRTVLANDAFPGTTVVLRDVVHPDLDVLARRVSVDGAPEGARLAYYANMNPTTGRAPRVPSVSDALLDDVSDFATTYDEAAGAMLHFRPYRLDPAAATAAVTGRLSAEGAQAAVQRTVGADGVYLAVGGEGAPAQFQAGVEAAGLVREEAEGSPLLDPYYDAGDGSLSGSPAAVGKTAGGQTWDAASGTVFLTAGATDADALEVLATARDLGFEGVRQAAEDDWAAWLDGVRLPATADPQVAAVASRALMLIRTAQDRRTGAIVANTTTQTPYRQDWLRDGAFFNYALLLAGTDETLEMVRRHNDFYRAAQSETGHWDPILCTDGAHCDAVFPFEIDSQAFGVWSLWMEYAFTGDAERLEANFEAIRKGTEVLWLCQDPTTGLQCYASEDDHPNPTQEAQGASTVYLGLRSGAAAARVVEGPDSEDATRWDDRADALRAAARERLCGDETCTTGRGYMIWPSRLLLADEGDAGSVFAGGGAVGEDPRLQTTLDRIGDTLDAEVVFAAPAPGGFVQYPMEPLFGLAVAWAHPDAGARLAEGIRWLTHDVAEPGVLHFGERIFHLGGGRYLHAIGFPHIWSGTEAYLAAALVYGVAGCSPAQASAGATCAVPGTAAAGPGSGGGSGPSSSSSEGAGRGPGPEVRGAVAEAPRVPGALAATGTGLLGLAALVLIAAAAAARRRGVACGPSI